MAKLHSVYIQKGHQSNTYEMYSFNTLSAAATLRGCAARFGLTAFIVSSDSSKPWPHFGHYCTRCQPLGPMDS